MRNTTPTQNNSPLVIVIKTCKKHGFETYKIMVNGTELNEYCSLITAEQKVSKYLHAWNVENVGQANNSRKAG